MVNAIHEEIAMEQAALDFQLEMFKEEHSLNIFDLRAALLTYKIRNPKKENITLRELLALIYAYKLLEE